VQPLIPLRNRSPIRPAAATTPAPESAAQAAAATGQTPDYHAPAPAPTAEAPLSEGWLIQQVLDRNPTLAQMAAAAAAASARYPQVTSLEDPMAAGIIGPASIGSRDVDFAYRLEASQRFPYPGKRALRGQTALAEARAAGREVEDARLQLVESARNAFYDFYLVHRALAVNRESLELLHEFRGNAESRYRTGLVTQQDVLQADVEIGRQRERLLTLERMGRVAVARINTLMHLPPDAPLPPPPERLDLDTDLPDPQALRAWALARRPDLMALADRVEAERAALALAYREYKPDFEVMAAYDAFWQPRERDLRTMVGVRVNLPVRYARRDAAVAEATAQLTQRQAEFARLTDQVNFDVQQAYEQARESAQALRLYDATILPAARENVRAAQATYTTGRAPFLSLVEAQRNLVGLRDRSYETVAEYLRRRAALERAAGGPLPARPAEAQPAGAPPTASAPPAPSPSGSPPP
jgi:outer membrane protein TolC